MATEIEGLKIKIGSDKKDLEVWEKQKSDLLKIIDGD